MIRDIDLAELMDALGELHGNEDDDAAARVLMDAMLVIRRIKRAAGAAEARARVHAFLDACERAETAGPLVVGDGFLLLGDLVDLLATEGSS